MNLVENRIASRAKKTRIFPFSKIEDDIEDDIEVEVSRNL